MKAYKNMNISSAQNRISFAVLLFAVLFFLVPAFSFAESEPRLEVRFESTPLFQNANFIPYDEVSRFVKVTNHTDLNQGVIVEAINYSSCPLFAVCFAKKLHLKITSGAEVYFDKPLSEFYGAGAISLGSMNAGATKQFDFRVVFEGSTDDNDFQKSTTNFDLLIGFAGHEGGGSSSQAGGNGTSGGGGAVLPGLQINNEAAVSVSTDTASVSWNTNYDSFSHVIYGIDTGAPYTLNLALQNFGYPSSAPTDPSAPGHIDPLPKTRNHVVNLSGLTPGATYRYRAVSHASPPTVGYEHTFTVPLNASAGNGVNGESDGIGGYSEQPNEGGLVLGAMKTGGEGWSSISPQRESLMNVSEGTGEGQNNKAVTSSNNPSAAFGALKDADSFSWWWLFLFILLFVLCVSLKAKKRQ
jgi:hypothetical protein